MQTFIARPSVWRMLLLLLGAIGFVIAGFWIAGFFGEVPKPGKEWAGWLSIVFFGFCAILGTVRLFDQDDQVRISGLGIYFKQWSDQTIPWSEINDVTLWTYRSQRTILLHLRDAKRFPSQTLLGKLGAANRALTGGDIPLTLAGTDRSVDDALAAIEWFSANPTVARNAVDELRTPAPAIKGFGKKGL